MNRIAFILACFTLIAAYHVAGEVWGKDAKLWIVMGMVVLYSVVSVALFVMRRHACGGQPKMTVNVAWPWKLLDVVAGLSFAFLPPLMISLARRETFDWESNFSGLHLLAMTGGVGVYLLARTLIIKRWKQEHGVTDDGT